MTTKVQQPALHRAILSPFVVRMYLVLLIAFAVRLPVLVIIASYPEHSLQIDSASFLTPACNLITHGVFSLNTAPPFEPDVLRTPGYPAFLAGFMLIWGCGSLFPVAIGQCLLSTLTVALTGVLGRRLFSPPVGLLGAILTGLSPISIILSAMIYSETFFIVPFIASLWLFVKGLDRNRWWLIGLAGLVFGIATLVRPIGLILLPVLIGLMFLRTGWRVWPQALILILTFQVTLAPWMARNYTYFGRFALTSVNTHTLYFWNVASLKAHRLNVTLEEAREILNEQLAALPPADDPWPEAARGILARQVIMQDPLGFLWFNGVDALNGLRPGWSFLHQLIYGIEESEDVVGVFANSGDVNEILSVITSGDLIVMGLEIYMLAHTALLLIFAAAGIYQLLRERVWFALGLLALISAIMLYIPGIDSNARFRAPVEPLLAILSGYAVAVVLPPLIKKAASIFHRRVAEIHNNVRER